VVAELVAVAALLIAALTETIHAQRCRRLARLAFGPNERPAVWARLAPLLRIVAVGALAWGFTTLLIIDPKIHHAKEIPLKDQKHLVMVLDVSPSMRLEDAGPTGKQSRRKRVADVMESFFQRVPVSQYKVSIVAVYSDAKAVVQDTHDLEVVDNILDDLPMEQAFAAGQTDIFSGLREAAKLAQSWRPKSTTVMLLSDGDTVPATGMPKMPASVSHVLIVGVGDTRVGRFINGRNSRQDASTLRQVAIRLRGKYHNANDKQLPTSLLKEITQSADVSPFEQLTRREYALIACAVGSGLIALLPLLLTYFGTRWKPGHQPRVLTSPATRVARRELVGAER